VRAAPVARPYVSSSAAPVRTYILPFRHFYHQVAPIEIGEREIVRVGSGIGNRSLYWP